MEKRNEIPNYNPSEEEAIEEAKSFQRVLNSFKAYRVHSHRRLQKSVAFYERMRPEHQRLLKNYRRHLDQVRVAIDQNAEFFREITLDARDMFEIMSRSDQERGGWRTADVIPTPSDMEKVQTTLKQFRREWSDEGKTERDQCFLPLIEELERLFAFEDPLGTHSHTGSDLSVSPEKHAQHCEALLNARGHIRVLVPGAGLGRLPFELAIRGFTSEGNEYSMFMLCASRFVLNRCKQPGSFTIYPNVHQYCNNLHNEDQVKSVTIPDVNPSDAGINPNFSMTAGEFTEVYGSGNEEFHHRQRDGWHAVLTSFFIDTAHNVVDYLETIWACLRPGGYWLNLGPLLYHFADIRGEDSIEPSFDDVQQIVREIGFEILKLDKDVQTSYCSNSDAMLRFEYKSVFMVCRKPESVNVG